MLLDDIINKLKQFLKRELKHHEKLKIEMTSWRELSIDNIKFDDIEQFNSGLAIIRIAYMISINPRANINKEVLNDFRMNLLLMLFKHGIQSN